MVLQISAIFFTETCTNTNLCVDSSPFTLVYYYQTFLYTEAAKVSLNSVYLSCCKKPLGREY